MQRQTAMAAFEEAREIRRAALRQLAFVCGKLADDDEAAGSGAHLPAHDTISRALTAYHCAEHRLTVAAQLAGVPAGLPTTQAG